jgi:2,4-dienoyl-CoA reductase-like NADH-dependent reductase (Old Yellow Enzyme family)
MADDHGNITPPLLDLYVRLAAKSVGAIITGHMYVAPDGQGAGRQVGIHDDDVIGGLRALTEAVHEHGAPIVAQISHAGSQSRVPGVDLIGPSEIPNPLTSRVPREATPAEISEIVESFALAARRAVLAGFDGVHLHGANGYLLSEFASPITNRRSDQWGGSSERRDAMALTVVAAVKSAVPAGFPLLFKIGLDDAVPGGTMVDESVRRAVRLVGEGVDAFEVSCGLMGAASDSAPEYVAVDRWRAVQDLIPPGRVASAPPEGTFRLASGVLKSAVAVPVILTGGVRRVSTMRSLVNAAEADLIGLARPFIRQPDLVEAVRSGKLDIVDCTSCNLCLSHSGRDPLQCWRSPRWRLLDHLRRGWGGRS